jgi:hypothetical protein
VGRKSQPVQVDFAGQPVQAETLDYALDDLIPNDEINAWASMPKPDRGGPPNPLDVSTMMLTKLVQLGREIRVAAQVFNTANYAAGQFATLSGTSQWSDFANSSPLDALLSALDIPIYRPNMVVLGQQAFTKLRQHPKVVQAVFGTAQTGGVVGRKQLAEVLEVRDVVVGAGFVNTSRKGQNPNMSRVWGKHCSLLYISKESAEMGQPVWGFTGQWGDKTAGEMPDPKTGRNGSQLVRVGEGLKEVISAPALGYFLQNVVA